MNFPINFTIVQPQKGFPRRLKACITQIEGRKILSAMGTFRYYHFLRDLFEDLSKFQRIGNLVFMKPGLEDLCISWTVIETMNNNELKESVIDGIENVNRMHMEKYRSKFSLLNSVPFSIGKTTEHNEYAFQIILKIQIQSPVTIPLARL